MLPGFDIHQQGLDRVRIDTPLGFRFWDPILDRQITTDLQVFASPVSRPTSVVRAQQTLSANYAFHKLPGLPSFTFADNESSPPATKPYNISVIDPSGQYSPIALEVSAPHKGLFLLSKPLSSPNSVLKGVYLFSAPSRSVPRWYADVRGRLLNENTDLPAAYAVVKASFTNSSDIVFSYYGISEPNGEFVVMMPYPTSEQIFHASPAGSGGIDLLSQSWNISIEVMYSPEPAVDVENNLEQGLPDYCTVLSQENANIRFAITDVSSTSSITAELTVNQQLILKTVGDSEGRLRVSPISS